MLLDSKKGGNVTCIRDAICLTEDLTKYMYKKVEQGSEINTETMKQEIEQEKLTEIKPSGEIKIYQKVVLNNVYKDETKQHKWKIGQF